MRIITDKNKINEILTRGVENVIEKENLIKKLRSGKALRIKHGVDPTGPKIHIGRAIVLWKLKKLQDLGHKIVFIIGDFTAQIGDASDKTAMRKPLTKKQIKENMKDYLEQIGRVLDLEKSEVHYNSEWLSRLTLEDILSFAMKFTAQQMIQRRNFKERWESGKPIGLHELLYPVLQGYDSVAVKADLEVGGFDQLFNLGIGREMQKMFKQPPQDIMVLKMLPGLDGRKMSTSWGNVVNILDKPKEMYGKLMSLRDNLMPLYFELCTQLPMEEVKAIEKSLTKEKVNPRDIKAKLAREVVALYYGEEEAKKAESEFQRVFKNKEIPKDIPVFKTNKEEYHLLDLLFETKLAGSKSDAKRLILQGGLKINKKQEKNWQKNIQLRNGDILQVGKRKFVKIILEKGK